MSYDIPTGSEPVPVRANWLPHWTRERVERVGDDYDWVRGARVWSEEMVTSEVGKKRARSDQDEEEEEGRKRARKEKVSLFE